jgi:hypothetical protein
MAKTVGNKIGQAVINQIDGASCRQRVKTEYWDGSTWTEFDPRDVESRTISVSTKNDRYQVTSFLPPSRKMTLVLNNFDQQYNTGVGGSKSNILKKNLLVRAWSGYDLTFIATAGEFNDDFVDRTKFVHTTLNSSLGCVVPDVTDFTGSYDTAAFTNVYDSNTYDTNTYTGLGYYKKTFKMPSLANTQRPTRLDLYTQTNRHKFKYRTSPYGDFFGSEWSTFSSIATGQNMKNISSEFDDNFLQYILTYEASTFNTMSQLCTATVFYEDKTWITKRGVFIIDDPKLGEKVNITGRDYLRKALETEINMPAFSGGKSVDTLITEVLDRCSIPYDTATWDVSATTASITSGDHSTLNNISGYKMLDLLMDYMNAGDDNWFFQFGDDGNAQLKNVPTRQEVDHVINANVNVLGNATKSTDSDKQIQRVTALNKNITVNAESTLATYTGNSGTDGSLYCTYSSSLYVRYTQDVDVISSETYRSNTAVRFTTNNNKAYTINIFGCTPKNAITDEVWAERGNSDNIIANDGSTFKKTNSLFNQSACNEYADYVVTTFADPDRRAKFTQWSNPFMEINDNVAFFDKDTSSNSIFNVIAMNESWNPPALNEQVSLQDTGDILQDIIYDRNGVSAGLNDLRMDSGLVWDMDQPFSATNATYTEIKDRKFA